MKETNKFFSDNLLKKPPSKFRKQSGEFGDYPINEKLLQGQVTDENNFEYVIVNNSKDVLMDEKDPVIRQCVRELMDEELRKMKLALTKDVLYKFLDEGGYIILHKKDGGLVLELGEY